MANQPNSYKKFVATAATAALVASALIPAASAAETKSFTDVNKNYKVAVDYLVANEITEGFSDTIFGTDSPIKRGDAAIFIAKALGLDTVNAPSADFTDVNSRVKGAVNAIVNAKIASGKSESTFAPDDNITRAEMAKILVNAYKLKAGDTKNTFTDVNSTWDGYVDALLESGVTLGLSETTFGATQNVTRGQFALFIHRAEHPELTVVSATATEAKTLSVKLSDGTTHEVTLATALEANKETEVTFEIDGKKYTAKVTYVVLTPEVVSVSAINAKQVEVKFNTALDADTVFANGENGAFHASSTVTLTTLSADNVPSGTLVGELSADGKTLTINAENALSKRYDVVVDGFKTVAGKDVVKFNEIVTFTADTTAPSVVTTSKPTSGTVKVTFSEPLFSLGTVDFKLANGTIVASGGTGVTNNFTVGAKSVTFTLGSGVAANTNVIATFIGTQDQAGNLISPNPTTVQLYKGAADGVAPAVASISQTSATKFAVKFSEQLTAKPVVKVGGVTINPANIVQDAADLTRYVVEAGVLDGATTVEVSAYTDLSGVDGATNSRVVTFVKDAAAPKVTSSAVVVDATDKKEYLELTFDKDVTVSGTSTVDATSGSYVKDFITTNLVDTNITATPVTYKVASNKKVVRVELDTFLGTTYDVKGAVYTLNLGFANLASSAAIAADTTKVTFTRGEDGTAGSVAVATAESIAQQVTNNSKLNVTFDMAVDGASATNPANYKVDGAVVESVTLLAVDGVTGKQVAVLNLKADSNGFTGTRNINIANVKALGSSKVMNPFFTNSVIIKENVAPKVTSAKLTATDTITLTFSENVTSGVEFDFEVLVGSLAQNPVDTRNAVVTNGTTATITVNAIDATELAKGISLKALSTLDIADAAGNKVSIPSNVAVSQ